MFGMLAYDATATLAAIPVADVVAAIDGPIALTECVDTAGRCETEALCPVRGRWNPVNAAVRNALAMISLADMDVASHPLDAAVRAAPAAAIPSTYAAE